MATSKFLSGLLMSLGSRLGMSPEPLWDEPAESDEQFAYQQVMCGACLLDAYTDYGAFPAEDRRTSKRGAKWLRQAGETEGAQRGAIFLAQALATLKAEQAAFGATRADELNRELLLQDAEVALERRSLVQATFPLSEMCSTRLDSFRVEFKVLETREIPDGTFPKNGFYMDILMGGEPREDMINIQYAQASHQLRGQSSMTAIELAIGQDHFHEISDELAQPESTFYFMTYGFEEIERWDSVAERWSKYGLMALGVKPDAPPLNDQVAQALRGEIDKRLQSGDPPPGAILEAMSDYAAAPTSNSVDWNVLVDAQMMGYRMREAECYLSDGTNTFDPEWVQDLLKVGEIEGDKKMFLVAAVPALDGLPDPFSFSPNTWLKLESGQRRRRSINHLVVRSWTWRMGRRLQFPSRGRSRRSNWATCSLLLPGRFTRVVKSPEDRSFYRAMRPAQCFQPRLAL